ncbi:nucleotide sugar dehydrogenase [Propionibacteriaceae bacterium Y1685]|uniref:nucleotide sugar dehydrogenase n=1 Tax=Microlunatus sp. Y1700 TaxID=3418487 RepID=UPI003B76602A
MNAPQETIVVIGQGYVGLPVAMRAAQVGYRVVGIDLDERRVAALREGVSFVEDVPDATIRTVLDADRYLPTSDYAEAEGFTTAVITVPTPLKETLPDLSFIEDSGASLAPYITPGATIILESTTYPGTTEELLIPVLEKGSGLKAGKDFSVGYSPERIDPGNKTWTFVNTPKVVSGIDKVSLQKVQGFYDALIDTTVPVSSPREAELTKLLENTFRHVNIALVNELAIFAHQLGVNVWESIEAASSKPFGFMKFTPGPGVGGHCLPVDPSYLSWQVRKSLGQSFRFVELANDVNDHMPNYVVQRAASLLNEDSKALRGSKVLIIGLAYKRDTGDIRESPALRIAELLADNGAQVQAADDHIEEHRWPESITKVGFTAETIAAADLVLIVTDHSYFDLALLNDPTLRVLDTRNVLRAPHVSRL